MFSSINRNGNDINLIDDTCIWLPCILIKKYPILLNINVCIMSRTIVRREKPSQNRVNRSVESLLPCNLSMVFVEVIM